MKSVGQKDDEIWAKEVFDKYEAEVLSILRILEMSQADYTIGNFDTPLEKLDISKYSTLITESPIPLDRITLFKLDLDIAVARELQNISIDRLTDIYEEAQYSRESQAAREKTEELHKEFTEYIGTPMPEDISKEKFISSIQSGSFEENARAEKENFLKEIRTYGTTLNNEEFIYPDPGRSYFVDAKEFLILLMKDEEYSDKNVLDTVEDTALVTTQNGSPELNLDCAMVVFNVKSLEIPDDGVLRLLNRFLVSGTFSIYNVNRSNESIVEEVDSEPFVTGESVLWRSRIVESVYNPVTTDYVSEVIGGENI